MPFDPFEPVAVGRTGLTATRLGLGGASLGGLFRAVDDAAAVAVVAHAWEIGIRSFDVAPLYGYGAAERRMGPALAQHPRDTFVLSTKVGRLVRTVDTIPPNADIDRQALDGRDDAYYADIADRRIVFDYSADGIRRSVMESLERLGLDRVDILYLHDPDRHWRVAIDEAYPALERLRAEGVVTAIGAGMNQAEMLARFASDTDTDVFLLANRYTLLDQSALTELLPRCLERGIAVFVGGVMNSGMLVDPRPDRPFVYGAASADVVDRAMRLAAICERHDVPLRAAAIQFPLAHPAVTGLIAGVRTTGHLDEYPASMRRAIPAALWQEMRGAGLLPAEAPTPG